MQIADKYSPQEIEQKWYDYWIDNRLFHSEPDGREPYTIVIPPPNVTGMLHMGHMLNNTLQDVLIRRARMSGKNACWVPGMDHARSRPRWRWRGRRRAGGTSTAARRAAGMSPPPCSTSTRGGAWTVRRGRASTPRSATTAASACGNRTPASAPSAGRDCRWAAQTERRKPPNDRL